MFAARGIDRVGKGIRGAPRDALIAELTPAPIRGAAFGLRQTLDTVGAFAGPLLAIALMAATADAFRTVFWLAVIPALVSVVVLVLFVREPPRATRAATRARPRLAALLGTLGARFWWLVLVAALFTLARFSEAFLILKVADVGLGVGLRAGRARRHERRVRAVGVSRGLALGSRESLGRVRRRRGALDRRRSRARVRRLDRASSALGVALWGLHMGFTQGLLAALVADAARAEQRGTAFGVFNFVDGPRAARGQRARRRALGSRRARSSRFSPAPR